MSHANTIQIFHVNTFFFLFGVFCSIRNDWCGKHPHAVNRMEYHILDMLNNHEKSLYLDHGAINLLFNHLSSENKELSAPCLSITRLQLLKVPWTI